MALTSLDGTFVQVNDKLAEMLGYTVEELSALGVRGITHPDDIEVDIERGKELRAGEIDSYHREKRYLRKDGSVLWCELTVSLVTGYEGEPTHVVSHVQDITERKEANLLFEATFERSIVPKLIADDNRRIVDLNQSSADLLGVSHDEALRLTVDELFPDEPVAELWAVFMEAGALQAEVTLQRPDGATRRIEFTATANVRPGPPHRGRARPLAAEGARGAAAPGAEDGGGRPARRRRRARLQQPPHRDRRLQRVPDRAAAPIRGCGVTPRRSRRRPRARPRSPASCSRSAAGRCCSRGCST